DSKRKNDFYSYQRFLKVHSDWPDGTVIRMNAEQALLRDAKPSQIIDWFRHHPPVTDDAKLRYILALKQNQQNVTANALLKQEWRNGSFNELNQKLLLT